MRLQGLNIYSQYFRFLLEDDKAITDNTESPFGPMVTAVIYDNERQTIRCACASNGAPCEHKLFIHGMIDKERDSTLAIYLNDCRDNSAQTITPETISRLRGAFAREYNFAKGVVQPPERQLPLGWQGDVPGSSIPTGVLGKSADTVIMDDLTMVERAEPVSRTGTITGGWLTVPTGSVYKNIVPTVQEESWLESFLKEVENTATSGYTIGIDPAKIEEDINKAKKLLDKKEKPKPEKPAKPRTRFTDLEL